MRPTRRSIACSRSRFPSKFTGITSPAFGLEKKTPRISRRFFWAVDSPPGYSVVDQEGEAGHKQARFKSLHDIRFVEPGPLMPNSNHVLKSGIPWRKVRAKKNAANFAASFFRPEGRRSGSSKLTWKPTS
jgi:hypothetical protein